MTTITSVQCTPMKVQLLSFLSKVSCTGHNKSFLIVLRNLLSLDRDDPTLDTIWEDMEQLCSQAVYSSASTETAATHSQVETKLRVETDSADMIPDSSPSPPGPPPPPPAPGGPPPPPPPPGAPGALAPTSEKMTKVAKSRAYRPQKNSKMINKVNWSKLSRGPATNVGAIWQKAADGEMDTKVDIDPARVEELFAKPDVKKVEEKTKPTDDKGKTVKVYYVFWNGLIPSMLAHSIITRDMNVQKGFVHVNKGTLL